MVKIGLRLKALTGYADGLIGFLVLAFSLFASAEQISNGISNDFALGSFFKLFNFLLPQGKMHYQHFWLDKVEEYSRLIQDLACSIDFHHSNKRKFGTLPGSPTGVMDVLLAQITPMDHGQWLHHQLLSQHSPCPRRLRSRENDQVQLARILLTPDAIRSGIGISGVIRFGPLELKVATTAMVEHPTWYLQMH